MLEIDIDIVLKDASPTKSPVAILVRYDEELVRQSTKSNPLATAQPETWETRSRVSDAVLSALVDTAYVIPNTGLLVEINIGGTTSAYPHLADAVYQIMREICQSA